jgi:hypothetical protein
LVKKFKKLQGKYRALKFTVKDQDLKLVEEKKLNGLKSNEFDKLLSELESNKKSSVVRNEEYNQLAQEFELYKQSQGNVQ